MPSPCSVVDCRSLYKLMFAFLIFLTASGVIYQYRYSWQYNNEGIHLTAAPIPSTIPPAQSLEDTTTDDVPNPNCSVFSQKALMVAVEYVNNTKIDPFMLRNKPTQDPAASKNSTECCPAISPFLVGRRNVSMEKLSVEEWEKLEWSPFLQPGGRYHPPDCLANHKVAIIVPFRDRDEHLKLFLRHMHPFLQRQQISYGIFVVDQIQGAPFNRAMLLNVGAGEALRLDPSYQCFFFHDVDHLPVDDRNMYFCPPEPLLLAVAVEIGNSTMAYKGFFGGVSAMSKEHFKHVNGYSNSFWGWGAEDDDMANRIKRNNLFVRWKPTLLGRYTMLPHVQATPNPDRHKLLRQGLRHFKDNGLNSLKYRRLRIELRPLYTYILVDLGRP